MPDPIPPNQDFKMNEAVMVSTTRTGLAKSLGSLLQAAGRVAKRYGVGKEAQDVGSGARAPPVCSKFSDVEDKRKTKDDT